MTTRGKDGIEALTEKEKQTLRLIVRGHDAKSIARSLDLSVHTINERLRDARRKLAVASSREAARLLLHVEGGGDGAQSPQWFGDSAIGGAPTTPAVVEGDAPIGGAGWRIGRPWLVLGVPLMLFALGLFALTALPPLAPSAPSSTTASDPIDPAVVERARQWLTLLDQSRWDESYRATGAPFRTLNTAQVWAAASQKVRAPLGAMISRTLLSQENLPAPPSGYEVVKFRTSFANKADAVETVTLDREDGQWRVVGVTVG